MRKGLGCGIVLVVLLLAVAGGGAFWLWDSIQHVTNDARVEGVIVDLVESRDSEGDLVYAPVVEYVVEGRAYRIQSSVNYGGLVVPDIGDVRTVYYDPDDPADATFRGFWTLWFFPALMVAVPIAILVLMTAAAAYSKRRSESAGSGVPEWTPPVASPQPVGRDAAQPPARSVGSGTEIVADFMGSEASPMDVSGRIRHRVRAQTEIDGVIRRFEGAWHDDDPTLDYMRAGNRVRIRIDPADPSRYEVLGPATE
jgi:hypothetical protein